MKLQHFCVCQTVFPCLDSLRFHHSTSCMVVVSPTESPWAVQPLVIIEWLTIYILFKTHKSKQTEFLKESIRAFPHIAAKFLIKQVMHREKLNCFYPLYTSMSSTFLQTNFIKDVRPWWSSSRSKSNNKKPIVPVVKLTIWFWEQQLSCDQAQRTL